MKIKTAFILLLIFMANFVHGQIKFRVKKLNADSLVALITEKEGSDLVEALNLLSNVICRKNIDSSLILASQAIGLSETLEYQKGLADGYFNVGNGYFLLDSLQPTISNYLKALRIYEDLEPSVEYGNLCMQISMINYYTGRFRGEGVKNYGRQALHIYERINDKTGQAMANLGMGTLKWLFTKEYDSAMYYHTKALIFLDPIINQTELAYHYREFGNIYRHQFYEFDDTSYLTKALSWHYKALELPEISDEAKAFVYLGMGYTYVDYNTDKAIKTGIDYLQKADHIADSCFDAYDLKTQINNTLGWIYSSLGDNEKAIIYFNQSIKIIEERLSDFSINDYKEPILAYNWKYYHKVNRQSNYEGLYSIYNKLSDYKKALEYNNLSKEAEEEIYKEKSQNLITMLESISEDEKIEKQMALLAKDNELKELAIKQSRIYLIALAGFILILVLVALLFFRQRKIRTEHKIFVREQKLLHDLELKNMESEKLKELDLMKSRFFANISHEFRTPLTLIKGPLDKVLSESEDENHQQELRIAKKYAGQLQILINNLLTISKLESGKMKLHVSKTDVVKMVHTYIQSFESLAKQNNIVLKFTSENKEIKAYIDREKFEQVLNNLLSNAFKFTGEGGVVEVAVSKTDTKLKANSQESTASNGPWAEINISDTGRGISPEHIDHIFDRFYQAGQENNNYYEGTGIGLALTKELVELHHGKIEVESVPGKGSIFTISLPLGKEHLKPDEIDTSQKSSKDSQLLLSDYQTSNIIPETQNPEPASPAGRPETNNDIPLLLIVEDNTDMRSYIRGYFETDYKIIEAIDGADGYEKSTEHIPDIIISDVMMPNMDGNEFCRKVKTDERTSHIPLILLTAKASMEDRLEGLETGADDFITKPFDQQELLIRVKNLIDQRKKLRDRFTQNAKQLGLFEVLNLQESELNSADQNFLMKTIEIVNTHFDDENFNAESLHKELVMSSSQLYRKLKSLMGMSTSGFIRSVRLSRAAELLKAKKGNVTEIAFEVGFNNLSYFTKCFQEQFGVLPSEYNT